MGPPKQQNASMIAFCPLECGGDGDGRGGGEPPPAVGGAHHTVTSASGRSAPVLVEQCAPICTL